MSSLEWAEPAHLILLHTLYCPHLFYRGSLHRLAFSFPSRPSRNFMIPLLPLYFLPLLPGSLGILGFYWLN